MEIQDQIRSLGESHGKEERSLLLQTHCLFNSSGMFFSKEGVEDTDMSEGSIRG
jgi:hypothetical protein